MFCTKCGANIPDDSKFCVHCGNKVEKKEEKPNMNGTGGIMENPPLEVICPGCGAILKPGTKFCTKCGMRQEPQTAQPTPVVPVSPVQPTPVVPVSPVQPTPVVPVNPVQPTPVVQPTPMVQPAPNNKQEKKSSKTPVILILVIVLLLIAIIAGAGYFFISNYGNPFEKIASLTEKEEEEKEQSDSDKKDSDSEDGSKEDGSNKGEKGDVSLLDPANQLVEEAKSEYEAGNYYDGSIAKGKEAIDTYITVAEENNLQEEAQEGINNIYWVYVDSIVRYCDSLQVQGANAGCFEQISNVLSSATSLTATLTEKGYSVDGSELQTYRDDTIQAYKDMYIECINNITKYENWSRDEAWSYAEQAYSIKEDGKPILFDEEDLEDPLRMRYVYCLAWVTRKRCETGLADGSLSYADAAKSMQAILKETDYNLLLIQDIITYGSSAGMDVDKYMNAYNAITEEIQNEQNLTIRNDIGINSVSSVDLKHFWYFNDLSGEDKYKVDSHNGTKATTREWIRNHVPVILGE